MCSFRPLSDKDQINSLTLIDHQLFTHDHPPGCTHLHNSPFITNSKTHISTDTHDTHWDSLTSTDLHLSGLSPTRQSHRYAIKRDYLILVWVSPRKEPIQANEPARRQRKLRYTHSGMNHAAWCTLATTASLAEDVGRITMHTLLQFLKANFSPEIKSRKMCYRRSWELTSNKVKLL